MAETPDSDKTVLLVDDDPVILDSLSGYLSLEDWHVESAGSAEEALRMLGRQPFPFVITDISMQGLNGIELLQRIKHSSPDTEVILMTGQSSEEFTIQALRAGAADYFRKPIQGPDVLASLMRTRRVLALKNKNASLSALVSRMEGAGGANLLIGKSRAATQLKSQLEKVSRLPETTILLTGESGAGKEVAARLIHQLSQTGGGSFVAINCGGISESLLERELFGHEKGAFTGADKRSPGVFEMALGGTVLLDEISEMTLSGQSRLLRVLEEHAFRRVGGSTEVRLSGTRVIAATNKDLEALVEQKAFRQDLFFRLNVVPISVPALRERPVDIPLLAEHFLQRTPAGRGKTFSPEALEVLQTYSFPGNIRELRNIIERAAVFSSGDTLAASDLSLSQLRKTEETGEAAAGPREAGGGGFNLEEAEKLLVKQALQYTEGNHTAAARELGITPQALYRRLEKHKLS